MAGMMSITGEEDGPPARAGASIGDIGASLFGVIGILAALTDRAPPDAALRWTWRCSIHKSLSWRMRWRAI